MPNTRDFPSGPGAQSPRSRRRRPVFDPWSGNQIPHVTTKTWCNQIHTFFFLMANTDIWKTRTSEILVGSMFSKVALTKQK